MKKQFLKLVAFIITLCSLAFGQVNRTTVYNYWKNRVVPATPSITSTWASFHNFIDDGYPWVTQGNAIGTNTAFIGSTDNRSLVFKTNNVRRFKIDSLGAVFNTGAGANRENIFYGINCGTLTTLSGVESAVFGLSSAPKLSAGNGNSIFGTYTARTFTNAGQNCVFCSDCISQATVTAGNNVMGVQALASYTDIGYNNSIGLQNMRNLVTGTMNIGNGYRSAETFTAGSWNIFLGANTSGLSQGNYNTLIGSNIVFPSTSFSNNIIIADGQGNIKLRHNGTNLTATGGLTVSGAVSAGGGNTVITGNPGTVATYTDVLFTTTYFHGLSTVGTTSQFYNKYPSSSGVAGSSGGVGVEIMPFNCTLVGYALNITVFGTLGTANNATVAVRINNTTDVNLTTTALYSTAQSTYSSTALNTDVNAGDYVEIKNSPNCTPTGATNVIESVTLYWKRR